MRLHILLCIVATLSASVLLAQDEVKKPEPLASPHQARQFADDFMKTLSTGDTYNAFGGIKALMPESANDADSLRDSTQKMLDDARDSYGKPIGYEFLGEKKLGDSLVRYEYILKLEKYAVHFRIIFYKPNDSWIPVQLWFDPDIRNLFEDLGK